MPLLKEVELPWNDGDIPRRIAVCRRILRILPTEPPAALRATVLLLLGDFLAAASERRGRRLDEALAVYGQAAHLLARLGLTRDRARTLINIAFLHLTRIDGSRTEKIEQSILAGEAALALVSPETDLEAWAGAVLNLAIAYGRRQGVHLEQDQERALSLFREAVAVLSGPEHVEWRGRAFHNLTSLYLRRSHGDREDNLEQAILCGGQALALRPRESHPVAWAQTLHNLGIAWAGRFRGERANNLENAIALFHAALGVRTREAFPWDWADTMDAFGAALSDRIQGDRADNLESAIVCYEQALTVRRRRTAPDAWAESQINRALAYVERLRGKRASNIELSIRISRQVLTVIRRDDRPLDWALATINLAQALQKRLLGDQAASFEESIRLLQSALEALDRDSTPREWARATSSLGSGYSGRLRGDRSENLEKAVALFEEALEVYRRDQMPWEWAEATHNLATVRLEHRRTSRPADIEKAIGLSEACLAVYTREAAPERWATTLDSLGTLYLDWLGGIREENVEKAISLLEQVLEVRTRDAAPHDWALTTSHLASAYWHRVRGEREDNLERTIALCTQALEVWTFRRAPMGWAAAQNDLGLAWGARRRGNLRDNRRRAAEAFRRALTVHTLEAMPEEHRRTSRNLGNLLFEAGRWRGAAAAYAGAVAAGELLYAEGATPQARSVQLWNRLDLPVRAAFALAKQRRRAEAVLLLEASRGREVRERLERDVAVLRRAPEPARSELFALRERISGLEAACRRAENLSAREFLALSAELRGARSALRAHLEKPDLLPRDPGSLPAGLSDPVVYLLTTLHGTLALVLHPGADGDGGIEALFLDGLREEGLTAIIQGTAERISFLAAALAEQREALAAALDGFWEEIRSTVVLPLVRRLRRLGYVRALLVPCGPLGLLPLPAMALDEMALAYAPSARIPLELAARSTAAGPPVLAAVGNPLSAAGSLPLASLEVIRSAEPFPAHSRKLLLGRDAAHAAVLGALPGATHLHFACHGAFDLSTPLDSALLLAGEDRLTLRDLLDGGIDLSAARLAVLSACQTAMSDQEIPDELLGFPAAFLQAGVPAVLGTLWRVGDLAATLLLSDFYRRHLQGSQEPVQALRGAQAHLRAGTVRELGLVDLLEQALERSGGRDRRLLQALILYRRKPQDSRPFAAAQHWAGFVLWGM